eukprot:jgi/Tetstr1/436517/TSEL_025343.t1
MVRAGSRSRYLVPEIGGRITAEAVTRERPAVKVLHALPPTAGSLSSTVEDQFDVELERKYIELRGSMRELPAMLSQAKRRTAASLAAGASRKIEELAAEVEALRNSREADRAEVARLQEENAGLTAKLAVSLADVAALEARVANHDMLMEIVERRASERARAAVLTQLSVSPEATDAQLRTESVGTTGAEEGVMAYQTRVRAAGGVGLGDAGERQPTSASPMRGTSSAAPAVTFTPLELHQTGRRLTSSASHSSNESPVSRVATRSLSMGANTLQSRPTGSARRLGGKISGASTLAADGTTAGTAVPAKPARKQWASSGQR